jgi:hypothetical protein
MIAVALSIGALLAVANRAYSPRAEAFHAPPDQNAVGLNLDSPLDGR